MTSTDTDKRALTNLHKRRGVVKASITRLETRLSAMESTPDEDTVDNARQLLAKLRTSDSDFKEFHMSMIDLIDDEDDVLAEQTVLDNHDDLITSMTLHVQKLITLVNPAPDGRVDNRRILARKLRQIQERLSATSDAVSVLTGDSKDIHRLQLHEEQMGDNKRDLSATKLISLDLEDMDELVRKQTELEQLLFNCSLKVKETTSTINHSYLKFVYSHSFRVHWPQITQAGCTDVQRQHTLVEKFLGTICYLSSQSPYSI